MKNTMIAIWCMAGALLFSSCGSGSGNETTDATDSQTATIAGTDSTITDENKELLAFAARNNMLQIELGKLAADKGVTNQVESYGQSLVDWYTTKQEELQKLAQQYNVSLPQQMESEQTDHLKELQEAEAGKFDTEYWENVTEAQKAAIDKLEGNLKDVDEASATAFTLWARNTLKELRAQYEQARGFEVELKNEESGISEAI
ncbi:DUF4142 domain-containing protein [Pontibacter korlensis]|uniref:DUF4142 domain-containing protein n=1 Tax=Pontibacter korlensis TaxID=400092 RepID=A0A0E3ZBQ7_9BACT|nr:DUF4142 domain-containing protein [Pontibacter korlensis]AKD02143.1 hypothetical protein PKOR_02085 [Pontibacter korlensis]